VLLFVIFSRFQEANRFTLSLLKEFNGALTKKKNAIQKKSLLHLSLLHT